MNEIDASASTGNFDESSADTRVVGLFADEKPANETVAKLLESGELKASFKHVGVAHAHGKRFVAVGLGKRDEFTAERARVAAALAQRRAAEIGTKELAWQLPDQGDAAAIATAIVEGTLLKAYTFDQFKSSNDDESDDDDGLTSVEVVSESDVAAAVAEAKTVTHAVNRARDLQNLPSNVATPTYLSDRAAAILTEANHTEFFIRDIDWIKDQGMGAFAAVAQGSSEPACLIEVKYKGGGPSAPTLGFVGKAVTFDTGGISLKPSGKMEEMKFDMSGGAAVLEATSAIARLELPVNITAVIPSTENMPDGRAIKPGDIVTAMNGKTIEINNTDAEGRLILADALAYTASQGVDSIINLATLTGAIIVALGSTYAGHFSNDDDWYAKVLQASDTTGELGHRLPLHPEYYELTKGKFADLTNASASRKASSIYAAEFLRQFVDDIPWVHVDIAGTAWDLGREYVGTGASGFGVRMLVELARIAAAK